MRTLLHLVRSDFRRLLKTPSVPILWLALPLVLSAIEYGAFGQLGKSSTGLPKGTLLLVDRDGTVASGIFAGSLEREPLSDFFDVATVDTTLEAERRLIDNKASAILVIPPGFEDSILTRRRAQLVFTPNPREIIRPRMVEASLRFFLDVGNRMLLEADEPLARIRAITDADQDPGRDAVMAVAGSFYDVRTRFTKLEHLGSLDLDIERPAAEEKSGARTGNAPNFFAYFLPGLLLFSLLLNSQGFERRYFNARQAGIERRINASPAGRGTVILAQAFSMLLWAIASGVVILGLGALLFRIPLRQPAVIGLTLVAASLFAVAFAKILYGRARSKRGAEAVASAVTLLLTLVGGGFAPIEIYSEGIQPFAGATPTGCASQAFVGALVHGKGLAETAPYVAGAWGWAIVASGVALWLAWRPRVGS